MSQTIEIGDSNQFIVDSDGIYAKKLNLLRILFTLRLQFYLNERKPRYWFVIEFIIQIY